MIKGSIVGEKRVKTLSTWIIWLVNLLFLAGVVYGGYLMSSKNITEAMSVQTKRIDRNCEDINLIKLQNAEFKAEFKTDLKWLKEGVTRIEKAVTK